MKIATYGRQIELIQNAYALTGDALNRFNEYVALASREDEKIRRAFYSVMEQLTVLCESVAKEQKASHERFDGIPLLQATLRYGDKTMRVAVAKPNESCDEPSIGESAYEALRKRLCVPDGAAIVTDERFPVCVVSRHGTIVAVISPNEV